MLRFAVVGKPVSHSKSPQIHSLFAQQTGIEVEYSRVEVEPENFEEFVKTFFVQGGKGLNITVPYKEKAFQLAVVCSPRAKLARAVNTFFINDAGQLCGDNTDGVGLINDIKTNHRVAIAGKKILILGAGGAVRGVLSGLINESPALVTILNRSESRAVQLQTEFAGLLPLRVGGYSAHTADRYDLIINGTSMGLRGETPPISSSLIGEQCCCYDLMYANEETAFERWAKANGARHVVNGIGMLVEQAAESFKIWCNIRPDTASVIKKLRET